MSTDPTGRTFLSYRRTRRPEAELLIRRQHEVGIPTWQDVEDLGEAQTATELRRVLRDPVTAGALLWLTPEVGASATIRQVEVPEIVRREQAEDGFFLVPVAAGGLDYDRAAELVSDQLGVHDLSTWNLLKVDEDPAEPRSVRRVVQRVLRRRLRAVHAWLPEGEPLPIRIATRNPPGFETGWALSLDWSHHFRGRHADADGWQDTLLPALLTVRESLRRHAAGRRLQLSGSLTLSAALALGRAISSLDRDLRLAWRQEAEERPEQLWSLAQPPEPTPLEVTSRDDRVDGEALALLVSLTADVEPAYSRSRTELPPVRGVVRVRPLGGKFRKFIVETPGEATDIVERTIEEVRRARELYRPSSIHVFAAIPVGLAVLLGQRLNTLGPVQTYEHVEEDSVGRYRPEVLLRPEDF